MILWGDERGGKRWKKREKKEGEEFEGRRKVERRWKKQINKRKG